MDRAEVIRDDLERLDVKFRLVLDAFEDPKARVGGSDAASVARVRRMLAKELASMDASFDQAEVLVKDFDRLNDAFGFSFGAGAAAVANERRMAAKALSSLVKPEGVAKVDELASFRAARTATAGAPRRRRKSG